VFCNPRVTGAMWRREEDRGEFGPVAEYGPSPQPVSWPGSRFSSPHFSHVEFVGVRGFPDSVGSSSSDQVWAFFQASTAGHKRSRE